MSNICRDLNLSSKAKPSLELRFGQKSPKSQSNGTTNIGEESVITLGSKSTMKKKASSCWSLDIRTYFTPKMKNGSKRSFKCAPMKEKTLLYSPTTLQSKRISKTPKWGKAVHLIHSDFLTLVIKHRWWPSTPTSSCGALDIRITAQVRFFARPESYRIVLDTSNENNQILVSRKVSLLI